MKKQIEIVYPEVMAKKFEGKKFSNYSKVATAIGNGNRVTVGVYLINKEHPKDSFWYKRLDGYGEVEMGADGKGYSVPRRLCHEY